MTSLLFGAACYGVATAVCLWFSARTARKDLLIERARVADLLVRLASRTPAEYVAVSQMQTQTALPEPEMWSYDPTGLIGVVDEDG